MFGQLVGALNSISFLSVKCCIKLMSCDLVYVETGGRGRINMDRYG